MHVNFFCFSCVSVFVSCWALFFRQQQQQQQQQQ
jgi:hypothetical protein